MSSFHIATILLFERLRVQDLRFSIATIPTFFTTLNVERRIRNHSIFKLSGLFNFMDIREN